MGSHYLPHWETGAYGASRSPWRAFCCNKQSMKKYILLGLFLFLPTVSLAAGSASTDIAGVTHYSDGSTSYVDVAGVTHFSDGGTANTDISGTTHYSNGATSYTDVSGTTHFSDGTTAYTDVAGITHYSNGSTSYTDVAGTVHFSGNVVLICPAKYSLDSISGKCKSNTSASTQTSCNYPSYSSCTEEMYSLLESQKAQATDISQFRGLGADSAYIQTQTSKISADYDQKLATCRKGIDTYKAAVDGYNQCIAEKNKAVLASVLSPAQISITVSPDTICKQEFGDHSIVSPRKVGYCACADGYAWGINNKCVALPPTVAPATSSPPVLTLTPTTNPAVASTTPAQPIKSEAAPTATQSKSPQKVPVISQPKTLNMVSQQISSSTATSTSPAPAKNQNTTPTNSFFDNVFNFLSVVLLKVKFW